MAHVCFFRHALALDERRVKFLPEYARGGAGPSPDSTTTTTDRGVFEYSNSSSDRKPLAPGAAPDAAEDGAVAPSSEMGAPSPDDGGAAAVGAQRVRPHTKEVWFAGCHSDMCVSV